MNTEDRIRIEQNRTKNANSLLKDFKTTTITKRKDLFILNDVCTKGGGNDSVGEGWACSQRRVHCICMYVDCYRDVMSFHSYASTRPQDLNYMHVR